jgi:hypothetical protein
VPPAPGAGGTMPGTVAEIYVSPLGHEFFLLIEGRIRVCAAAARCSLLTTPGQYIVVMPDGVLTPPATWTGPMLSLTASADFLQAYLSQRLERGNDVLPRYRDINDALRPRNFVPPTFAPVPCISRAPDFPDCSN